MISNEVNFLLKNPDILNEDFIPPNIPSRENQIKELSFCISPALKGNKPCHAWVFGPPGTGKTSTCKFILRKMEYESNLRGLYVNCWENNTYYSVLDYMVRIMRILRAEKLNTSFKKERLAQHLKDKPFIVFLDEVDQLPRQERDNILYNLSNMKNIGIVAISNSKNIIYGLDERIRSRLNAQRIEFKPYAVDDLHFIINQRAEFALKEGSLTAEKIRNIAVLSDGDARIAIQTLKNAAYLAEKEESKFIKKIHIRRGHNSAKELKKTYLLDKLTEHHRILYRIIKQNGKLMSGKLWDLYIKKCKQMRIRPIALRTYSEYMRKLIETDLVKSERAMVRGRVRLFEVI